MARKHKGRPVHGWVIVDKPEGISSNDVVVALRRLTGAAKAGHGGTLDPLATGILPIAFGEATKTVSFAMDGSKVYRFEVWFGEARSTDDAEGEVVATSDKRPEGANAVRAAIAELTGDIEQVPPAYSAVKVAGERAYKLARRDEAVELAPRPVHVERFNLVDMPDRDHAVCEVACGKGTYMRALARDLALKLGTVGHIRRLRRTAVGPFGEDLAYPLRELQEMGGDAVLENTLLAVETVLADIPALALTEQEARRIQHGQAVPVLPVANRSPLRDIVQGDVVKAMVSGRLVALAHIQGGEIRPLRVMNL